MAVKNTQTKEYNVPFETMRALLRKPEFSTLMDAPFIEEAILSDGVEFRYIRKTDIVRRYGRNYFIKLQKVDDNTTSVAVTTQSRKVTVLFDTSWKREVTKVFNYMDILLSR